MLQAAKNRAIVFERRDCGIGRDRELRKYSRSPAVFGNQANAMPYGIPAGTNRQRLSIDFNTAADNVAQTKQGLDEFGALCANQAADTQNFAPPQGQADVLE